MPIVFKIWYLLAWTRDCIKHIDGQDFPRSIADQHYLAAVGTSLLLRVHHVHPEPILVQRGASQGSYPVVRRHVEAATCLKPPSSFLSAAPLPLLFILHTRPCVLGPRQQVLHILPVLLLNLTVFWTLSVLQTHFLSSTQKWCNSILGSGFMLFSLLTNSLEPTFSSFGFLFSLQVLITTTLEKIA